MQPVESNGRWRCVAPALLLGVGVCVASAGDARPAGLVGWWRFDEARGASPRRSGCALGAGRLVRDSSGQANDAIVTAGVLVKGVRGAGLKLNGRATRVRCAASPSLSLVRSVTIEAWVRLHSVPSSGFPAVVRKDGAYALRFDHKRLGLVLWNGGEPVHLIAAKTDWAAGRWYHLAGTYDGAKMRLFVDGREDGGSPRAQSGAIDAGEDACYLGSSAGGRPLDGVLDEVRLYGRALTPAEIAASHARGRKALREQKDATFAPKPVGAPAARGAGSPTFRKPGRPIAMIEEGFLWIDAEDFTDYGGWWLDTQFVHLMGSAYLIAAGVGKPVADAAVDVDIPEAGTYRLWVRARNWLKGHAPGRFRVLLGQTPSKQVFGAADSDRWVWESGGDFALKKARTRLVLRDLTGYYGRCDTLILTTDLSYTPPAKVADIRKERSRLTGLSLEPKPVGEFDVIVVGGGAAGCCAAIASARMGAKTALIQNRPVLGGNASIECGVSINGAASCHPNARESGIIEQVGRIKARYGYPRMSEPFRLATNQEQNLSVFLNRHVFAVDMRDKATIAAVQAVDTLTGTITRYKGRLFIDCTGDGWVGFFAGAKYRRGREGRRELDESLAPEKPDEITMSGCIMGDLSVSYRARDSGAPAPYTPPPWAPKFPSAEEFGRDPRGFTGGQWWLEHEGTIDDLTDAEKARDELIRITFGYWDWIKNTWPQRHKAANYALTYVPITDAKRESRRLVGDHILTQNDVQKAVEFPDRISYGGWPIDVHHPRGIYSGEAGPFDCNPHVPIYTIPFRCLYSVNIDNLLFAGRDMSVSHIALGTVRVQGTLAALGQAAGTAAALCLRNRTTPRGLWQKHIRQLQQTLLKHDQYIPGLRNEDPLDLARKAKLAASSTARYEEFGRKRFRNLRRDRTHPLNMPRAVMFPRGLKKELRSVFLRLASEAANDVEVVLHLRGARETGDFSSARDLATAAAAVPPGKGAWVEFKLERTIDAPYVWVWLPKTEGVSWVRMGDAPIGSCRAYGGDGNWTPVKGQFYAFHTRPDLAVEIEAGVANVTNGVARIVGTTRNLWASDPAEPMPQWVELSFGSPVKMNAVYLTFDTDLNAPFHTVPLVAQCVRDYELSYHDGAGWQPLAAVRGNFQRRRVHRFDAVSTSKLRLTVHATHGDRSARVFEIRAYNE